jgi:cyclopropane-fatty-acyl-phospholipid synthase
VEAAVDRLLFALLRRYIRRGSITITAAGGATYTFGDGSGRPAAVRFTTRGAQRAMVFDPELKLGEAYMDGTLVVERGTIADVIAILLRQEPVTLPNWALPRLLRYLFRRLQQYNRRSRSRHNVAHHYDLDGRLYSLFLDNDQQYSCAYFESPDQSLDDAQLAKRRHLAAKLCLKPGANVLDIGCGWGGLALSLARAADVEVEGITLSTEQLATARWGAESSGLADRARFSLTDYRDVAGPYDRIVSVGMFEHVGRPNYQAYFDQLARLLADDGLAVIHSIGRASEPDFPQPWIAKYIFPGGYIPSLSEVLPCVERAGLIVTDIEILRLHYAETLRCWRERFEAQRPEIERMYDARFCRMWEYYLALSELAFRYRGHMVFQLQLAKRIDAAPITRDYMARSDPRIAEPARQVA